MTDAEASPGLSALRDLDQRSRTVFRQIVETYLATGDPVGSRTLSRQDGLGLSPASIRNTMADLTQLGLLTAPHVSAGRLPTQTGLRLFVDGLLELGQLARDERRTIEARLAGTGRELDALLTEASEMLSGLAGGAGLVVTPSRDGALKHVEFVALGPDQTLVILVFEDGTVENRLMKPAPGVTPSALAEAGNYLSNRLKGRTLADARAEILAEIEAERAALDAAARRLVAEGLASWSQDGSDRRALIVRGQARLLESVEIEDDLARVRLLFDDLERKEELIALLEGASAGDGVRIFIGSENPLFSLSGSSVIVAPYRNQTNRIVGAIGVIGPTRLNYARVIPMVDYTAQAIGRLLEPTPR